MAVRIVLLGKTGSGKSSAGNVILGEEKFQVSSDPNSVTKDCQTGEGNINGMKISVTDTPGIFDIKSDIKSDKDLKCSIISCLTECAPGPHAFILVLRVGRYTMEEQEAVRKIRKWFGEEALKHTVVLFTHGDELDENQTIKKYVNNNKHLADLCQKCGDRVHVIDSKQWHKNDDKNAQYADLLEQLKKMMIEKREAGESQAVHTLEELKSRMLEPRTSTPDQQPSQGSERSESSGGNLDEPECRSNSFQIKQLLTTIDNMVRNNGDKNYTNESLEVIAKAIQDEVGKINKVKTEGMNEQTIRSKALKRIKDKMLKSKVAGATVGALLGLLLGATGVAVIPVTLLVGVLTAGVKSIPGTSKKEKFDAGNVKVAAAAVTGTLVTAGAAGGAAAGTAGAAIGAAEAAVAGAVIGAGAATGIGLGVAAGVYAIAGAVGGGMAGAKAGETCINTNQAAKESTKAVGQTGLSAVKAVWDATQKLVRSKESPYENLQE